MTLAQMKPCASRAGFLFSFADDRDFALARLGPHYCLPVWFSAPSRFESGLKAKASKSATGKVERRWLSLFVAAMGALAIFAPARRLLRYALDFMHRKPLTIDGLRILDFRFRGNTGQI